MQMKEKFQLIFQQCLKQLQSSYAEIDQYDEKASRFNREAENALSQSGRESESALQTEGMQGAAEQGRETAAATERRTGPPEKYSVEETDDGRAVAVVDDDILSGIDTQTWDKTKKRKQRLLRKRHCLRLRMEFKSTALTIRSTGPRGASILVQKIRKGCITKIETPLQTRCALPPTRTTSSRRRRIGQETGGSRIRARIALSTSRTAMC